MGFQDSKSAVSLQEICLADGNTVRGHNWQIGTALMRCVRILRGEYGEYILWVANMANIFCGWRIYFMGGEYGEYIFWLANMANILGDSRVGELALACWL